VIRHEIVLGRSEKDLAENIFYAYSAGRAGMVMQGLGIPELAKEMKDPLQMVQIFYSIAMILEFLGIETGLPTPADAGPYWDELKKATQERWERAGDKSKWYNPASWKGFDFIGDLQASAFGIDRDNPDENFPI
jgi:hypothetical protein